MFGPDRLLLPLSLLAICLAGPLIALAMAPPGEPGQPMLVMGPAPDRLVARAGGRRIGPTAAPFAVLATGDHSFRDDLLNGGAWAVLDADWLAALCRTERN